MLSGSRVSHRLRTHLFSRRCFTQAATQSKPTRNRRNDDIGRKNDIKRSDRGGAPPTRGSFAATSKSAKGSVTTQEHLTLETDVPQRPTTKPYETAVKVKQLWEAKQLEKAIQMVKDAPLDAQNTKVWNTLIKGALVGHRFKLAFELFNDMKKRAFRPDGRTFVTLLSGFARMEDASSSLQLERVHTIFNQYDVYIRDLKSRNPTHPDVSNKGHNEYLRVLDRAEEYQRMFDIFYAMDQEGPLAPDQFTSTRMMLAIGYRKVIPNPEVPLGPGYLLDDIPSRNAADVRLLWNQMVKASERNGFHIDSHSIAAALFALGRGRSVDHDLAFSILREYLGLYPPGVLAGSSDHTNPKIEHALTTHTLTAALELCLASQKYTLCDHFIQGIMDNPSRLHILQQNHIKILLESYGKLASRGTSEGVRSLEAIQWVVTKGITADGLLGRIKMDMETYSAAFLTCWRSVDWDSTCKIFRIMTGYDAADFRDGMSVRPSKKSKTSILIPDAESMSSMLRTALASREQANVRQCLRIIDYLGVSQHFFALPQGSSKFVKHIRFFRGKLALGIKDAVDMVNTGKISERERNNWKSLAQQADKISPSKENEADVD